MTQPYRVLITGSRTWTDRAAIHAAVRANVLLAAGAPIIIVHGACPSGADAIAEDVAVELAEFHPNIAIEHWPANWRAHGRSAGYRRNADMVSRGADVCLAFIDWCIAMRCDIPGRHGSHGATHCAGLAEEAGITVKRWTS